MIRLALVLLALGTAPVLAQQAPATPQKVTAPATQQKATAPATPQKVTAPATQQKATTPPPQQKATTPPPQQKATTPPPQQKAATPPPVGKSPAGGGSVGPTRRVAPVDSSRITLTREVYAYPRDGRRDPFGSLIATGDVRPLFTDLIVTGIMYDARGRNSLAMLQDVSTSELYRARVGSVFGRIRITAIREREVAVAIDEFGFTRQEVLSLNAPSPAGRTP